jgi:hypothetical protein
MSNHFSADNLKFPGDDRRLDITDLFVFTSPEDPDTTVLILNSNPTSAPPPIKATATGPEFYPGARRVRTRQLRRHGPARPRR